MVGFEVRMFREQLAVMPREEARKAAFLYWVERTISPRYRNVRLASLKPSDNNRLPVEDQQKLYDLLRAKPDDSYAILGAVGTGKTTVSIALYRWQLHAEISLISGMSEYPASFARMVMNRWELPVVRMEAKDLLQQHHDFAINRPITNERGEEIGGAPEPLVSRERIEYLTRRHRKFRLFLEEIDKVELTKARRDTLFSVVNAIYEHEGQLVINTNLNKTEFANLYGAEFVRRIKEMCTVKDLYEKEQ